ncbi:hypothetical protein [Actinoplanes sp. NPDC049265]|uniref:hypothetical protein n=1 Tax=Actinoplanes sp. NPDC049265 TaxID=3363902 RepID=UPI00372496B3
MTRHEHARSEDEGQEASTRAAPRAERISPHAAAILALQRQAGNTAVSRMIDGQGRGMPGAWPEEAPPVPAAPPPTPDLSTFPETAVDLPRPRSNSAPPAMQSVPPSAAAAPRAATPDMSGLGHMFAEPRRAETPDMSGMNHLFAEPRRPATPDMSGLGHMFAEPRRAETPDMSGMNHLFAESGRPATPDMSGLGHMFAEPRRPETPDMSGMGRLFAEPRRPATPDMSGLGHMFAEPRRPGTPDMTGIGQPFPVPKRLDGDLAKAVGAGVAAAVPPINIAAVKAAGAPNLVAGGTGMASASAIGDAASEVVKWMQSGSINLPKFLGGVLSAGGLVVTAAGIGAGSDATRYVGLGVQTVGLGLKSAGEAYKWEDGDVDLSRIPSGDISKAVGAFVAAASPILQATAIDAVRRFEEHQRSTGGTGPAPTPPMAVAAALLAGGNAGGDFFSEVVKGVRDRKINVPKMVGGLLGMIGAGLTAGGVASGNSGIRYAGLGFQELGLIAKSAGEAKKWEDTRMGRVRRTHVDPDIEMV